jgi:hypothetical protein
MKTYGFNIRFTRPDENNANVYEIGYNAYGRDVVDSDTAADQVRERNAHVTLLDVELVVIFDEDGNVIWRRAPRVGDKFYTASAFVFGDNPASVHISEFTVKSVKSLVILVQRDLTQQTRVPVQAIHARYAASPAEAVLRLEKQIDEEVLKARKRKSIVASWLTENLTDANYLAALKSIKLTEAK